ncbi:MAG: hypothetical protein AAGG01_18345 [Planctomycetota bacterium]
MTRSEPPRWPLKGPTAFALMACGSLWLAGQRAEKLTQGDGAALQALKGTAALQGVPGGETPTPEQLQASLTAAVGDELAAYGPFAGLKSGGLPGDGAGQEEEQERKRPPGWVYPAFDKPAEGLHGPPASELPRNVSFRLQDGAGEPLDAADVEVFERTVDGEIELSPYRSESGVWTFGVRGIMTGSRAFFRIQVPGEGTAEPVSRTLVLDDVGTAIDLDGGVITF